MSKVYRLYEVNRNGQRTLIFHSLGQRQRFLKRQRAEALKRAQQVLFKGTEYLRIYSNCVIYNEYDIRARKPDPRQQAERFFKHAN